MSNASNPGNNGITNAPNPSNFPVGSVSTSSVHVTGLSRGPSLPSFPANPSPAGASSTFGNAPSPPIGPAAAPNASPPALPVTINIRVLVAHTGRQLIFQRQSTDSVATLMQLLVQYADIAIQDQILLCEDGVRVYPNTAFSRYPQLLKDRGDVFLFNRSHLAMKSKPAKLVDVDAYQFVPPNLPPAVNDHPLFQFNSALVRALPEFERSFDHHVEIAQAYITVAENRVRQCVTLLDEQKAQLLSVGVAVKNLSCHSALISAPYTKFVAKFDEESPVHKSLLDSFESDLSQLQKVELHPRLRTVDRSTLLDCVPEGKLRAWAKDCGKDYDTLAHKMKKLRAVHRLVEDGVISCETEGFPTSEFDSLDKELQQINRLREEQQTMLEVLRKDASGAHRMIGEMVQELKTSSSTINALDICKALDTQDSHHKQQILPRFEEIYRRMRSAILLFAGNQERVDLFFFKKITKVSELQSSIRDLGSKTTAYTEALTRQKTMFDQLHNLRSLPAAYNSCVAEVSRRRKFRRRFLKKTEEVVESFNKMRTEELNARDAFQQQYGQSIVREIFPSLAARLPTCELTVKDAEDVLPEIELEVDADTVDPAPASSVEFKAEEGSVAAQPGFRALSPAEQIRRLVEENSTLRSSLGAAQKREEQTQTDSSATAAAIAQLTEELSRERDVAAEIGRKLSSMENQIQALRETTQRAESERDEKQQILDRNQQYTQQLETAQRDWKEREQKLMVQHQSLQQEKRDMHNELQSHRDQLQQLKQQLAQQQQQQLQASRDQQNYSPNQGASVATLSSIVSIPSVSNNAIGSVCRQCYVNPAFIEPSAAQPHPFCGRACAKDYEIRRQSALSQQHKLPPSPTNTVSSTLARRPSLGSSGSGVNIPNSSSRSGLSPGIAAMPTGSSPPSFSLGGAKALEKDQHSDCVEKISSLTQSLTAAQQKLRECQANSADLENKFHKAEHELERLRDDKRKLVANITDLQNHLNNMSVNSALLLKAKEELQVENKQLITNNERLRDDREMWMEFGRMRIAFTAFAVKDVVLFYRDEHNNYIAFNKDCPHRYLSPESQAAIREPFKFILGEVCLIERRTVPEGENAAVNNAVNPYRLPPGTEFYCLTVETLYTQ